MGDGGVTISTGQLIAAFAALFSVIGSCFALIRHLYEARLKDKDETIAALQRRVDRFEVREDEARRASDRVLSSMEAQVEAQAKQAEVSRAMYERLVADLPPNKRVRGGQGD